MNQRYDIEFESSQFCPDKIMEIRHHLAADPLLSMDSLRRLALRLPDAQVRFHAASATESSNFTTVEHDHPPHIGLEQALSAMEQAGSWIALHNVQTDPEYAALLKRVLAGVKERINHLDPGMFYPAFWVFIQSPGAVTPYHMDHEQNFLMQIQGEKVGKVWPVQKSLPDAVVAAFHARNSREGAVYTPDLDAAAQVIKLKPGVGVYMPYTSPHAVMNGNHVSITISFTYCTRLTRRVETIHRCNYFLKKCRIRPRAIGTSPVRDAIKYHVFNAIITCKNILQGRPASLPYWSALSG